MVEDRKEYRGCCRLEQQSASIFVCIECNFSNSWESVAAHCIEVHGGINRAVVAGWVKTSPLHKHCWDCDTHILVYSEVTRGDIRHRWRAHMRTMHNATDDIYPCELCDQRFTSLMLLKRHARTSHNGHKVCYVCLRIASLESEEALQSHLVNHSVSRICRYCNTVFDTRALLYTHLLEHHWADVCACPVCTKAIPVDRVQSHCTRVHRDLTPLVWDCGICGVEHKSVIQLRDHVNSVH